MSIVFGLGSGRCGTKSLQSLLNIQPNSVCFHEVNPSCMAWNGAEHAVLSTLSDFSDAINSAGCDRRLSIDFEAPERDKPLDRYLSLERIDVVGDIASYYLPYVEKITESACDVVFPCIVRQKDEVIESFVNKVRVNPGLFKRFYYKSKGKKLYRNHWSNDGAYLDDARWDRLHPNVGSGLSLRDAIAKYYDEYYEEIDRLCSRFSNVKIFDISVFNSIEGREKLLRFCGVENPKVEEMVHENAGFNR